MALRCPGFGLGGLGAAVPALLACAAFGIAASSLARTSGTAMALAVVPVLLFELFPGLLGPAQHWLFFSAIPLIGDDSSLIRLSDVARAYSDAGWEPHELVRSATISTLQAAALLGLACAVTSRRAA